MVRERIVPFGGLSFVVVAALMLWTVILRNPDTHGHLWTSLPSGYDRTPLDTIGEANLQATLAELPPFEFPAASGSVQAAKAAGPGSMAGMADMGTAMASSGEEVQQITLTETEFAIAPNRVTIKRGVPVELTVKNNGKQVHGLWLPDFGIFEDVRAGKAEVFKFTPEKSGRFRYTCSYSLCGTEEEHAKMLGFLTVQ